MAEPVQRVYHGGKGKNKPFGALAPELKGGERPAIDGRSGFESRRCHYRCAAVKKYNQSIIRSHKGGILWTSKRLSK